MEELKKYTGTILNKDIIELEKYLIPYIVEKYKKSIYDLDFDILSKEILSVFINEDIFSKDFDSIRNFYIERFEIDTGIDLIPINEKNFNSYICSFFLNLEKNDISSIKQEISKIIQDLNKINKNILRYTEKIKNLKNDKKNYDGKTYDIRLYSHYLEKNKNAEEQIIAYLRANIDLSCNRKKNKFRNLSRLTYSFNFNPGQYYIENFSPLKNKLLNVNIVKYKELLELFYNDETKFFEELEKVINFDDLIFEMKELIGKNHCLYKKGELLNEILELYKNKQFSLFINIIPMQIEGLIYDLCLEYGIDEESLTSSSLRERLNLLQLVKNKLKKFDDLRIFDFEYFLFYFPIIRNKAAHGILNPSKGDSLAKFLLLDLYSIFYFLVNPEVRVNIKLKTIREAYENKNIINLIKLGEFIEQGVDPFYVEEYNMFEELKSILTVELTYNNFFIEMNGLSNEEICEIKNNVINLKQSKINKEECILIIKEISKKLIVN